MTTTSFTNGVTVTDEDWFNDVNRLHYTIFGDPADIAAVRALVQYTAKGTQSCSNAAATTLFAASAVGMYTVFAYIADSADAANYTAKADVFNEGTTARILSSNGGLLTLTLSGTNLQATQSSGGTATVSWIYRKMV